MKTEHTPGPWKTNGSVVTAQHDMRLPVAICVSKEDNRPTVDAAAKTREQAIANARLIASAPDLLAALEECITSEGAACFGDMKNHPEWMQRRLYSISNIARAAIAKAKGQE